MLGRLKRIIGDLFGCFDFFASHCGTRIRLLLEIIKRTISDTFDPKSLNSFNASRILPQKGKSGIVRSRFMLGIRERKPTKENNVWFGAEKSENSVRGNLCNRHHGMVHARSFLFCFTYKC